MYASNSSAKLPNLSFFADSSSRDHTYMGLGGFAVSGSRIQEIQDTVFRMRDAAGIQSEFSWKKYRGGNRRQAYFDLVDYGFELIRKNHAHLHIKFVNFSSFEHRSGGRVVKRSHRPDRDTSINKIYYQMALHRLARYYGKRSAIHLRLDSGADSEDIIQMREEICAAAYKRYQALPNCIRSIEHTYERS